MINHDAICRDASFRGAAGDVRHVILANRAGVFWDSVPYADPAYTGGSLAIRPRGFMSVEAFAAWAVEHA